MLLAEIWIKSLIFQLQLLSVGKVTLARMKYGHCSVASKLLDDFDFHDEYVLIRKIIGSLYETEICL